MTDCTCIYVNKSGTSIYVIKVDKVSWQIDVVKALWLIDSGSFLNHYVDYFLQSDGGWFHCGEEFELRLEELRSWSLCLLKGSLIRWNKPAIEIRMASWVSVDHCKTNPLANELVHWHRFDQNIGPPRVRRHTSHWSKIATQHFDWRLCFAAPGSMLLADQRTASPQDGLPHRPSTWIADIERNGWDLMGSWPLSRDPDDNDAQGWEHRRMSQGPLECTLGVWGWQAIDVLDNSAWNSCHGLSTRKLKLL